MKKLLLRAHGAGSSLARIMAGDRHFTAELIAAGLARPYEDGARQPRR